MTDTTPPAPRAELSETCRCGSSTSVKAATLDDARTVITTWRADHHCTDEINGRAGATTALPGGVGFRPTGALGRADIDGPGDWGLAMVTPSLRDAVRLVEDTIDATSDQWFASGGGSLSVPTARTGLAVVEALIEAGWSPPVSRPTMPTCTREDIA